MDVRIELDSLIGVYGVAHLPLGDSFRLYGAAGWTEVTITTAARAGLSQASDEGSEDGFSWGVGGQVDLGETVAVSVEYMQYLDEKDIAVDSLGLGIELFF
jgi:opacity protein-like surface antigen